MRAASDLEVSGHSLRVGAAQDLLIKGYDLARHHARRRVVGPEYRLEVLAVFAAQHLEIRKCIFCTKHHIECSSFFYSRLRA